MTDVVARTVKHFCRAYGIGKSKTYELIAEGKLEIRKVGTRTLITEESAQRWVAEFCTPPTGLPTSLPTIGPRTTATDSKPRWTAISQVAGTKEKSPVGSGRVRTIG